MSASAGELPELEEITNPTWEQALHKLLDPKLVKYHTEIDAPHSFSTLDVIAEALRDEYGPAVSGVVDAYRKWLRDNLVAKQRKRAHEIVEGVKATQESQRENLTAKLLGNLVR
jgi:hypothetical protein